jgi:hypothetical protein
MSPTGVQIPGRPSVASRYTGYAIPAAINITNALAYLFVGMPQDVTAYGISAQKFTSSHSSWENCDVLCYTRPSLHTQAITLTVKRVSLLLNVWPNTIRWVALLLTVHQFKSRLSAATFHFPCSVMHVDWTSFPATLLSILFSQQQNSSLSASRWKAAVQSFGYDKHYCQWGRTTYVHWQAPVIICLQ